MRQSYGKLKNLLLIKVFARSPVWCYQRWINKWK